MHSFLSSNHILFHLFLSVFQTPVWSTFGLAWWSHPDSILSLGQVWQWRPRSSAWMGSIVLEKKRETAHIVSIFNPIEWLKHLSWFLLYSFCISCRGHHYQRGGCSKAGTLHSHWHNFIFGAQIYYLEELQGVTGIPRPLWLGKEGSYQAMILESLGSSLYCLFKQTLTTFNLPFVAKLGLQMVSSTLITL